ncbi:MAG: hypothetical protein EXS64_00740 [Candidatus Latescibacteria bacterium]|nr:hypothetical protein [Candidatus Latescibacterota bacterium]
MAVVEQVEAWVARAQTKLQNGGLDAADLDELLQAVRKGRILRQRLLYLHAATPGIRSQVIGMALHEPTPGSVTQIEAEPQAWPYKTVHDAILDAWKVIHFPDQRTPFDDREIDLLGYEFILQKLEDDDE